MYSGEESAAAADTSGASYGDVCGCSEGSEGGVSIGASADADA